MSCCSFTSNFSESVSQTCSNYIRSVCMQKAIIMMRKTEKSFSEIAEECGFYDGSHFRQLCTELYGVSPMTLRRDMSRWTQEYGDTLYGQSIRNHIWAYAPSDPHWNAIAVPCLFIERTNKAKWSCQKCIYQTVLCKTSRIVRSAGLWVNQFTFPPKLTTLRQRRE